MCVSLFEKKGDTKIYHCAKPLVVYKRRPGKWPFFPPRDFVVRSPRGRPFGPALDQFRYYRVERKLATHPNVLTTSFRYGDKSSGVDTTQGRRNRWCRGQSSPSLYILSSIEPRPSSSNNCPTCFKTILRPCNPINRRTLAKFDFFLEGLFLLPPFYLQSWSVKSMFFFSSFLISGSSYAAHDVRVRRLLRRARNGQPS